MILVIDNYDSFTYNLVQYIAEINSDVKVVRNDEIDISQIIALNPTHIVISPGPGRPDNAGISKKVISHFYKTIPILGVCLGHQAIGEVFGMKVVHAPTLMHGKTSLIYHDDQGVYKNISNPFEATRYHSLVLQSGEIPKELLLTSKTKDGVIMGLRHKTCPLEGVQFHPESILTQSGKELVANFLKVE